MAYAKQIVGLLVLLGLLVACGGGGNSSGGTGNGSGGPGSPAKVNVVAGTGQSARVGTAVPNPIAVVVLDAAGNSLPGQQVQFVVTSGGGSVSTASIVTDSSGNAQTRWTLGTSTSLTQELVANAVNGTTGVTLVSSMQITATALPGPAVSVVKSAGDNQTAIAGSSVRIPPAVSVFDSYGNPVPGVSAIFSIPSNGAGSVTDGLQTTNTQGVAAAGGWTLGTVAGSDLLVARVAALPGLTFYATGTPGPPTGISIAAGNNQTGAPGGQVPVAPAVLVADMNGNGVPGVTVVFTVAAGGGSVAGNSSVASSGNGIAAVTAWTLGPALGTNTLKATALAFTPVQFTATGAIGTYSAVAGGMGVTCGLQGNAASCWGDNTVGELGDGTTVSSSVPAAVTGGLTFTQLDVNGNPGIYGNAHACGLTTTGTVYCWGSNGGTCNVCSYGLLGAGVGPGGDNSLLFSSTPLKTAGTQTEAGTPLSSNQTYVAVSVASVSACAIGSDGNPYCWGSCSTSCGLPEPAGYGVVNPTFIPGGPAFSSISTGGNFTCALTSAGAAYCWGSDDSGAIGDGHTPTAVLQGLTITSLSADGTGDHSCVVSSAGNAYCWGNDGYGELGNGTSSPCCLNAEPVTAANLVLGGLTFVTISSGATHTCALTTAGAAYCWGDNGAGEVGDGTSGNIRTQPTAVVAPSGVTAFAQISAGNQYTCATASGSNNTYCWGANNDGQFGNGSNVPSPVPTPVSP